MVALKNIPTILLYIFILGQVQAAEPKAKVDVQVEGKDEQENIIHGVVYNEGGEPVAGALVLPLPWGGYPVESDVNGKFELMGPFGERVIFTLFARAPADDKMPFRGQKWLYKV